MHNVIGTGSREQLRLASRLAVLSGYASQLGIALFARFFRVEFARAVGSVGIGGCVAVESTIVSIKAGDKRSEAY